MYIRNISGKKYKLKLAYIKVDRSIQGLDFLIPIRVFIEENGSWVLQVE